MKPNESKQLNVLFFLKKAFRKIKKIVQAELARLPINGLIYDERTVYVLSYAQLTNIGDEIQSIATHDFLLENGLKVRYVERESLSRFFSFYKRRLILNGWFSHDTSSFPPSRAIIPIFVGFHLANLDILKSEKSIRYFKRHQSIGCRDKSTLNKLTALGIDAYYTSCPTLLIKRKRLNFKDECLVVDAHLNNPDGHTSDARDLLEYVLNKFKIDNVRYVSQNCEEKLTSNEKIKLANKRLDEFASSKLVITNRIHVALPCLAMGTPVIFLHENPRNDPRIESFLPLFWFKSKTEESLPNVNTYLEITNKTEHLEYQDFLKAKLLENLQKKF